MEKLDMICFDENGQAFVDWDSLEAITNTEFVEVVKKAMYDFEEFSPRIVFSGTNTRVISIIVYIKPLERFFFYDFFVSIQKTYVREFWEYEFANLYEAVRGEVKWQK